MPILTTMAIINLFSPSDPEVVSFLNPDVLRVRCIDEIEDIDKRERAVKLTEELQQLSGHYQKAVVATVEAYIAESVKWESSANGLIELLEPWDSTRTRTLQEIVRVRQAMREILTAEQWNRVFR
jgi:hypothetical protein